MSISYEEALSTLQAMFGDQQWNRDLLDAVLRHQQGHMENTVDLILRHSDKDPAVLVQQLQAGVDLDASTKEMDEQLARTLQEQFTKGSSGSSRSKPSTSSSTATASAPASNQRGAPTVLPDDFLRIPGRSYPASTPPVASSSAATTTAADQMQSDEALARMLQDEWFTQQLSDNPEFSHLARGRSNAPSGRRSATSNTAATARGGGGGGGEAVQNIMGKLSVMGDQARFRLQKLAAQFQNQQQQQQQNGGSGVAAAGPTSSTGAERRGLLDGGDYEDDEEMELTFAQRKDL